MIGAWVDEREETTARSVIIVAEQWSGDLYLPGLK